MDTPRLAVRRISQRHASDENHAEIGRHTDGTRHLGAMPFRPCLHYERHAEGPFAAHTEGRHETRGGEVRWVGREIADAAEDGIEEDTPSHRLHAADAVTQPAEGRAPEGGADEKSGGDDAHPAADPAIDRLGAERRNIGRHHALEGRSGERREERLLVTIHHPAEEAGEQRHLHALGDRIAGVFSVVHGDSPIRRT